MNAREATSGAVAASRRRLGYTLLEIMTSVTLALMLMYAVARIFSYVGGAMNETMSTMEMNNALRNARNRLTSDLEALSVSPAPPRNSKMNEGYLCYVEGMGGPFNRVVDNNGRPFASTDVALDSERYAEWVDNGQPTDDADRVSDNTVGDLDDILSFTAKAPEGQPFRGRYVEPIYSTHTESDADGNTTVKKYIADAKQSTFESQYAEIIWFVRGTTLYRRVLPIMSDEMLQESLKALQYAATAGVDTRATDDLTGVAYDNIAKGFGFYYFYDVSIHLGSDGRVVANTLGDLTNRENRYFYWNSCGLHLHPDKSTLNPFGPYSLHGANGAWYWLRMATLQESAAPNFRAGAPFGENQYARDFFTGNNNAAADSFCTNFWSGFEQILTYKAGDAAPITADMLANQLPVAGTPFIDFWNAPNVWDEVNYETGDLNSTALDLTANGSSIGADKAFNQDVILTNVLSFNVKVWDDTANAYVDLGACAGTTVNGNDIDLYDPDEFTSFGYYGDPNNLGSASDDSGTYTLRPWLPCVYDTWSEQYQRDLYVFDENRENQHYNVNNNTSAWNSNVNGSLSDIPSDGAISSSQLKDYPPPYNKRVNSIQVELRVFDPRSKTIRSNTMNVDLSRI